MSLFGKRKSKKNKKNRGKTDRRRFAQWEEPDEGYDGDSGEAYYEEDYPEEDGDGIYDGEEIYPEDEEYAEYEAYEEASGEYPQEDGEEAESGAEYYEEEYYGDTADYYETDGEEAEYAEEEDADLYYVEEGEYEDLEEEEDEAPVARYRKKKGVAGAILAFRRLPLMDKIIAFTGAAVLVFAVITAAVFMAAKSESKAVAAFADVGSSLDGIGIIGESGLLAMADAQAAKSAVLEAEEIEKAQEEIAEQGGIHVALKMTSIVKDLKIKFVNTETDKLVPNVPFQLEVTTPDKKTETWSDDDKDGIIYQEEIAPGTYSVKALLPGGEQYAGYKLETSAQSVEVKANIQYEKVDVADEIKTEAEVNAAIEDTAVAEVVEESKLTDTVPFVKSTQSESGEVTYQKIDKSTIQDPGATASIQTAEIYLMTEEVEEPTDPTNPDNLSETLSIDKTAIELKAGETATITITTNQESVTAKSGNENVAKVSVSGKAATVTGVEAGETDITFSAGEKSVTCRVSVSASSPSPGSEEVTLPTIEGAKTLKAGETTGISLSKEFGTARWESSDTGIFTVESSTNTSAAIKGIKAGKATLTVTFSGNGAGTVSAEITVTEAESGITADPSSVTIGVNKTAGIAIKTVPDTAKITAVSSGNEKIATAVFQDKTVTVTGVAAGDTKITIKGDNGKEVQAAVKVVNTAEQDTTSLLKDKNGNQVYVFENGKYRKAVYADYYKFDEFYLEIKGIVYTGWQTIDGKTYYYLENHKYVTGEQVIQGAKYTFASDGSLLNSSGTFGIDVSKWNGSIDWNSVKSGGVSYAIIRCGYRGSSTGALITDPKFAANIAGANAAGIKTGIYFFTQAVNEKEAVEEASMVLSLVKKYKISYPIFLDVESSGGRADGIDKATRTAICKAFCATIQNSGYTAGVYANKTWLSSKIDAGALASYKIWLAQYAAAPTYTGRYNLWQYSSKGSVPGISGNVDLNQSYLGY